MESNQDFNIRDGVLITYNGPGGDVVIPEGVTKIGYYAFLGCTSLRSVTIPESVTKINEAAFLDCTSLQSVTIPEGVIKIDEEAFRNCISLQSVAIPKSVTKISEAAFHNCTSLQSVTILSSVPDIDEYAFGSCENLATVFIPESVIEIDKYVFQGSHPALIAPCMSISDFKTAHKPGACCGFAKMYFENIEMDEEVRAGYLEYIKRQKKKSCRIAIKHEELLQLMIAEKMLVRKDIDLFLEECDKQNNAAAKAAVEDYINTL